MHPSKSTWTWTVVQTPSVRSDFPDFYHLHCSPSGELLMIKELVGKFFTVWAEQACPGQSAEPTPGELERARSFTQVQLNPNHLKTAHSMTQIERAKKHYTAAYTLPGGQPQVPPTLAATHQALQESDGWWFVPKTDSAVPKACQPRLETSQPSSPAESKNMPQNREAQNPALRCQPKRLALEAPSEAVPEEPALKCEPKEPPAIDEATKVEVGNPAEEPKAPNPNFGNGACTEACRSDHRPALRCAEVITRSPDEPISSDHRISRSPDPPISSESQAAKMMDDLEQLIQNHLVCTHHQRAILALWILHTYCYQVSFFTPYLNIYSSIEESGKSTCMTILRALCAQPWWATGASRSAFTRKIIADRPTVLLDNWQTVFSASDKNQITGFLLTGCNQIPNLYDASSKDGNEASPEASRSSNYGNFGNGACAEARRSGGYGNSCNSFCPKAFAGQESLPPSLARRSIPIHLQRSKRHQHIVSPLYFLDSDYAKPFTSRMQDWVQQRLEQLHNKFFDYECHTPSLSGLSPHQQDGSNVLLALADTLGGSWPQKIRAALQEVFRQQQDREVSPLQLLSDIRDAFAQHQNPERIFTAELLTYLHSLDHRTWHEWSKNGEPMTAHALSRMLRKSFNIYSRSQRRGKDKRRGYQQSDFIEAWERYLPDPNPHFSQENRGLSQCPVSNPEAIEDNAAAAGVKEREPVSIDERSRDEKPALRRAEVACTEANAEVACTEANAEVISGSPDCHSTHKAHQGRKPFKTTNQPGKSSGVSMSQFKTNSQKPGRKAHRS